VYDITKGSASQSGHKVHSIVDITRLDRGRREPVFIWLEDYNRYLWHSRSTEARVRNSGLLTLVTPNGDSTAKEALRAAQCMLRAGKNNFRQVRLGKRLIFTIYHYPEQGWGYISGQQCHWDRL